MRCPRTSYAGCEMPDQVRTIYWDSCVSLSYINGMVDRIPVLDSLLEDCTRGVVKLHASDLSRVEVAFAAAEKEQMALDPVIEQRIDGL